MIIPVYTLPLYDIGMMISLRTGCTTNNAEDITPTHTHGFSIFSGSSFIVATAPITINAGTHSHELKLKLPVYTAIADSIAMAAYTGLP